MVSAPHLDRGFGVSGKHGYRRMVLIVMPDEVGEVGPFLTGIGRRGRLEYMLATSCGR